MLVKPKVEPRTRPKWRGFRLPRRELPERQRLLERQWWLPDRQQLPKRECRTPWLPRALVAQGSRLYHSLPEG